jgi:hypothetical protein
MKFVVGGYVQRYLAGRIPMMELRVSSIEGGVVRCGPWTFDARTGAEIDDLLDWNAEQNRYVDRASNRVASVA